MVSVGEAIAGVWFSGAVCGAGLTYIVMKSYEYYKGWSVYQDIKAGKFMLVKSESIIQPSFENITASRFATKPVTETKVKQKRGRPKKVV